mmetsp:Transcript_3287/g.10642  ORF Transcript_3287/g.10642 Transcript_3287/m.10642 type:complete len:567 (-) Transcript_3287:116-1816(-)
MSLFALFYRQVGGLLFLDTDFALLRDPYTQLKAPPLSRASLVLMPDLRGSATPVNAGLWYAQGAGAPSSAARWVVEQVARRTEAVIRLPTPRKQLPPYDQAMLNDALASASRGVSTASYMCTHPRVAASSLCASGGGRPRPQLPWLREDGVRWLRLSVPTARNRSVEGGGGAAAQAPLGERAALAPPSLFPTGWEAQRSGALSPLRSDAPALVHLLGVRCRWCGSSLDLDASAKFEWAALSGYFAAAALRPSSVSRGSPELYGRRCPARHHALRWEAGPLLRASPRDVRAAERSDDGGAAARVLIRALVSLAVATGRQAVLPSFRCSAPWIESARWPAAVRTPTGRCAPCNVEVTCRPHALPESLAGGAAGGTGGDGGAVVDVRALADGGRLLDTLSALTGPAAVVAANLTTAQIAATADGLDAPLLVGHPRLARAVASNLRGVSGAPGRAGQAYFRAADEVDAAERVARWRKEVAQRGSGGRSPLSLRLGAVCSDLLCSDEACHAAALRKCNEASQHAGKAQWTGEVVDRQRAARCREWLNALPKAQRPVCDGVLGECIVPDPPP